MSLNSKSEHQDLNTLTPQSWVMPQRLRWLNSINQLRILSRLDHYIPSVRTRMVQNQRCHSTPPTSTHCQLSGNRVLTTTTSLTSRALPRRYGNIVVVFSTRASTKPSTLNRTRSSKPSTYALVRMVRECWVLPCFLLIKRSSTRTLISIPVRRITSTSLSKTIFLLV